MRGYRAPPRKAVLFFCRSLGPRSRREASSSSPLRTPRPACLPATTSAALRPPQRGEGPTRLAAYPVISHAFISHAAHVLRCSRHPYAISHGLLRRFCTGSYARKGGWHRSRACPRSRVVAAISAIECGGIPRVVLPFSCIRAPLRMLATRIETQGRSGPSPRAMSRPENRVYFRTLFEAAGCGAL